MNDLGENLLRFKKDQKYLCLDFETECLSLLPPLNKAWQLTYGVFEGGRFTEIHDRFLWWKDLKMSAGAAQITRFDYQRYKERAEDPKKVLEHFESFLYDESICNFGHNTIGFDIYIHNALRARFGLKSDYSFLSRAYDTQNLYKAKEKGFTIDKENIVLWNFKISNYYTRGFKTNLGHCCREMGIEVDKEKQHDAKYDICLTGQLFNKLIWAVEI